MNYLQTMHDNALTALADLTYRVNAAAGEVERLKKEDEEAKRVVEAKGPILMRAMADVDDAKKKLDDDDDEAGAAGAVAQVAQLAADPELYPYSILTQLAIYGYPYLLSDAFDFELFHNAGLSEKAQDDFLLLCETYAADAGINWCDLVSPMPVVLVEVAIKNSKSVCYQNSGIARPEAGTVHVKIACL
ncbi:MAG: hypothetical protein HC859_12690 [Bacteroidia bacterium]|nr:hypothetical protein [Bacteroidia bacterium]